MDRELFIKLAFCRAYEIKFGVDEHHTMDNLDYSNDDNYCCLEDAIEDEKMMKKIDEYGDKIRNFVNDLD